MLTAFTYPYVYLPVAARLAGLPPSIEESARLLGDRPSRLFFRIVLPAIRSSVLGGMLIVFLYSLSEFGAVQLLGFDTLTRVVYATRLVDRAQSFAAATLLLVLAVVAVTIERRLGGSLQHSAPVGSAQERSGRARSLAHPRRGVRARGAARVARRAGGVARTVGVARHRAERLAPRRARTRAGRPARAGVVDGVARHHRRHRRRRRGAAGRAVDRSLPQPARARTSPRAVLVGFAVPGLVIALSLAFWALNVPYFDRLYQSTPLLITAYVVHFGAQAMRSTEVAVATVPRRVRESARCSAPRRRGARSRWTFR